MDAKKNARVLFAAWLAEQQPAVFNALLERAVPNAPAQKLAGFTDFLSSIGSAVSDGAQYVVSGLSSGIQSVGSFLGSSAGQQTLSTLVKAYATTQPSAANVLNSQYALAQNGQAPAPVQMVWNPATQSYVAGNVSPMWAAPTGGYPAVPQGGWPQPSALSSLSPYLPYLLGGAALLAVLALRK